MEESHENQILFSDSTTVADDDGCKTIDVVFLYTSQNRDTLAVPATYLKGQSEGRQRCV